MNGENGVAKGQTAKARFKLALPFVFMLSVLFVFSHDGLAHAYGYQDAGMFVLFFIFMIWLLTPRKQRADD